MPKSDTVATVLTVYGIETEYYEKDGYYSNSKLQQCLPFTVLKPQYICSLLDP